MTLVALLLACEQDHSPCHDQRGSPSAFSACLAETARGEHKSQAAAAICALDPTSSDACRSAWVDGALGRYPAPPEDDLLAFCPDEDCRFRVVDTLGGKDLLTDVTLCESQTEKLLQHCVRHSLSRWAIRPPTAEDMIAVRSALPQWVAEVDAAVGQALYCETPPAPCRSPFGEACTSAQGAAAREPDFCHHWREGARGPRAGGAPPSKVGPPPQRD